ncbi:MAG: 5-amino-6-(D-ribitylamino)uracil--L-tyrosine 4-hydroxyphenyl transferase CofH [Burkholderiales bacterium]|nr:5-amino-6-(D-ribitylamino)uracil--L-tyrosine 4-hydroxyphenyl transferase CofH [Burkholderiales bacterium]
MDLSHAIADEFAHRQLPELMLAARAATLGRHGSRISYSRKVFIPLTRLCRDSCHYCTFATAPRHVPSAYLTPEEVIAIARAGARAGCKEALFTLGDKPELRYGAARRALAQLGYESTSRYLEAMCERVVRETGLLPHVNAGVLSADEIARLRRVSVSQGLMLESTSERLCAPGGPHHGSPDKVPKLRLDALRAAGEISVATTSGILIGIGETRAERIEALAAIADLHRRYGHIQEVIIQNFRAKPHTRMAHAPEPALDELLWTIAIARLLLGPDMNIQAPPNLSANAHVSLIAAGINDFGGISPVTLDHVNPEAPWPAVGALVRSCAEAGSVLVERLAIYPAYACAPRRWLDAGLERAVLQLTDSEGYARTDPWQPGIATVPTPRRTGIRTSGAADIERIVQRAGAGERLDEPAIVRLFAAREDEFEQVCGAADALRRASVGDAVTYVVNRNINYTNVCQYRCNFCAFSKGTPARGLRGPAYDLSLDEIERRTREAWERGATEVCMQGGIHPSYNGDTYLALLAAVKRAVPAMHVHAFSPLEIAHGAATLKLGLAAYLERLRAAGLGSLPGTAAEILDDEVRALLCPDKLDTRQWLEVVETAHRCALPTTATIMFGHLDRPIHWARHLLHLRDLQSRTGGISEFVPLPFVAMEAPIYRKGRARPGPTYREAVLMHAVARLALHPLVRNIQVSWVKMGNAGAAACLEAGANDLGGTLMNESISRAAGTQHGQELAPGQMDALVRSLGRTPVQRTTRYAAAPAERREAAYRARPLLPIGSVAASADPSGDRVRPTAHSLIQG